MAGSRKSSRTPGKSEAIDARAVAMAALREPNLPRDLDIHVILDNLSAHKAPEVTEWLAKPAQQRRHLPFIPTSSSWINLVERWFKELTDRRLRRGVFTSVPN
jgi:transposase